MTTSDRSALTNGEVAEVYARYGYLVRRRALTLLRSESLADDAMQNTFIKVMRYGAQLREADSPLRWLYRVADRCCFDLMRSNRRLESLGDSESIREAADPSMAARVAARDAIVSFLDRLNDLDRQIAVLAWVDELNQDQIAAEVNRSRQTVNKRLGQIRERAERFGERNG